MRHTTKALLLLMLCLAATLCACRQPDFVDVVTLTYTDSPTETTSESIGETTPVPEAPQEMVIVEDGKTAFRLIRPEKASDINQQAAILILQHLTAHDVKIQLTTDWDTRQIDQQAFEILVGNTAYTPDEAKRINTEDLGTEGFVIQAVGNKICLRAGNDDALIDAAAYLIEHFLDIEGGKTTMPSDYLYISSNGFLLSEFLLAGTSISEYAISTDGTEHAPAAEMLSELISDKCGLTLSQEGNRRILLTSNGAAGDTVTASFENGDLVIRAKDGDAMKKAVLCFWMEQVYHEKGTLSLPTELSYSRDLSQTVFYSDFSAPQSDSVCCMDALIEAHNYANQKGYKVFADYGGKYYISSTGKTIPVKTDVEWGNAAFIIDDSTIPIDQRGNWIFTVASNHAPYTLDGIDKIDRDVTNLGITLPQKSLVTIYDSTTRQYIRSGGNANSGSVKQDTIVVDRDGSLDMDAPLIWDFDTVTSVSVLPIDETPLCISGGSFTTIANRAPSEYTYYARGIYIGRSHTTVKNVKHYITGEGTTGAPYAAFLQISSCAYVTIEDCLLTGHKTYQSPTTKMGSYDINGTGAISLTFKNCTQTNDITDSAYWGILGSNFCKNLVYDGCILSRFDAHQGVANASIINSTIGHMGANAIGYGTLLIENSKFYSSCIVNLRNDYGSTWEGDIIIRNCTYKPAKDTNCYLINGSNHGTHDYGYTCYMPRSVTIEGLHVDSKEQMYVFANLNPNCTSENYTPAYPYIVTESVTVKDFTSNGTKDILLSPNKVLFRETEFTVK